MSTRTGAKVPGALQDLLAPGQRVDSFAALPGGAWLAAVVVEPKPCAPVVMRLGSDGTTKAIGQGYDPSVNLDGTLAVISAPDNISATTCSARGLTIIDLATGTMTRTSRIDAAGPLLVATFARSDPAVFATVTDLNQFESAGVLYVWRYADAAAELTEVQLPQRRSPRSTRRRICPSRPPGTSRVRSTTETTAIGCGFDPPAHPPARRRSDTTSPPTPSERMISTSTLRPQPNHASAEPGPAGKANRTLRDSHCCCSHP